MLAENAHPPAFATAEGQVDEEVSRGIGRRDIRAGGAAFSGIGRCARSGNPKRIEQWTMNQLLSRRWALPPNFRSPETRSPRPRTPTGNAGGAVNGRRDPFEHVSVRQVDS